MPKENAGTIVLYYSRTGNNRYLALRLAQALQCSAEEILPRGSSYFMLLLASLTGIGGRHRPLRAKLSDYDHVILCGPLWMGQLAAPLRSIIRHESVKSGGFSLVSCCGSDEAGRSDKFGYDTIFAKARQMAGEKLKQTFALPIGLAAEPNQDQKDIMKLRLSDSTFSGAILMRFDEIVSALQN